MTINGITYKGFINVLICSFLLSFSFVFNGLLIVRFGSFKKNIEMNAADNPIIAATKNGRRVCTSARNPPIPGPIIKPVLMAADIYPSALDLS